MKSIKILYLVAMALLIGVVASSLYGCNTLAVAAPLFLLSLLTAAPRGVLTAGLSINDTSYAGEVLAGFISYATTGFQTLRKGCINVLPGIVKSATIPVVTVDSLMQAPSPEPVHGGSINVDARLLVPKPHMAYLKFNPNDFKQHWWGVQMQGQKLLDTMLPTTAESAIIQEVLKYNGAWMDRAVWQSVYDPVAVSSALENGLKKGDNSLIFMDGILKKIQDAANTITILPDSAGPAVELTTANIFSKFELVKGQVPEAVYENPKFKFLISYKDGQTFAAAQKGQDHKGVNTIVAGLASRDLESNFWLGVHELDEEMFLHLKRVSNTSLLWFLWMMWAMDVNIALEEQTVLYTTNDYRD